MAGKSRQKSAANVAESVSLSLNERILKDCHALYTDSENGEIIALSLCEFLIFHGRLWFSGPTKRRRRRRQCRQRTQG